jgi:hypothetical protein
LKPYNAEVLELAKPVSLDESEEELSDIDASEIN